MVTSIELAGGRALDFTRGCLIMGILNCTPDSFYDGSKLPTLEHAFSAARLMIESGADILDVGGESTRPGAGYIEAPVEIERVVPIVEKIRSFSNIPISVDTRKYETAKAAVEAGADIINDISALKDDPALGPFAADRDLPVILMHKRGTPKSMQDNPWYEDAVREVKDELLGFAAGAAGIGIRRERIILDPGIGFGKRLADNLRILESLPALAELGYPLLLGVSRKSFLGTILRGSDNRDKPPEDRLAGSLAAAGWCILNGANIIRVHDVSETADLRAVLQAITRSGGRG